METIQEMGKSLERRFWGAGIPFLEFWVILRQSWVNQRLGVGFRIIALSNAHLLVSVHLYKYTPVGSCQPGAQFFEIVVQVKDCEGELRVVIQALS